MGSLWVGVSVIHDLRSAICIYFSGGRLVWEGVTVIHDLGSMICIYLSSGRGGGVVVCAFSRSAILNLALLQWW